MGHFLMNNKFMSRFSVFTIFKKFRSCLFNISSLHGNLKVHIMTNTAIRRIKLDFLIVLSFGRMTMHMLFNSWFELFACVCTRSPAQQRAGDSDRGQRGARWGREEPRSRFTSATSSACYSKWQTHCRSCCHRSQPC